MKKLVFFLTLYLSAYAFAQFGNQVGTITTINLKPETDRFSVVISGDGKLEPNTVVIDNPPRIALDFVNVKNALYPKVIEAEPNSYVHRIRTSLYAKGRETISRVTIDLKNRWDYSLFKTRDGVVLSLAPAAKPTNLSPRTTTSVPVNDPSATTANPPASTTSTVPPPKTTSTVPPPSTTSEMKTPEEIAAEEKAAEMKAAEIKAAELKAAEMRAAELKAAEERAAEIRAAELKAAELKAAEKKAAEIKAAEMKAAEIRAAELKAAEKRAAELKAAEIRAAEKKAAEIRAAEKKAAELKAAEIRAAELKAAEIKAAEKKAAELKAAELKAAEIRAAELKAAEKRAAEKKAAEERAAEIKAAELKVAELKAADKKAAVKPEKADKTQMASVIPKSYVPPPPLQNPSASVIPVSPPPSQDIVIGSEDLLEVAVFELPQFNTTARVQGDGTITMPLVGSIDVRGLKKKDVEAKIAAALQAKYVNNANVSVNVKEYKSRQVSVLGEVKSPGAYYVMSQRTLIQLLSEAGGLSPTAGPKCYIFRPGSPKIEINLRDLMVNGNPDVNVLIYPGDVVNVPTDVKVVVYVLGAVRIPGAVHLSTSMPVTLLAAIAGAGGPSEYAKQSDIKIKRKNETGEENTIKVNLKDILKGKTEDIPLFEGDIVTVPESFF